MKSHIPSTFPSRENGFFFRAVNMHRFRINVVSVHSRNTGSKRSGQGKEHKFGHRSDNSLPETHAVFALSGIKAWVHYLADGKLGNTKIVISQLLCHKR